MSEEEAKSSAQEAKILEKLDHPNIVKFLDTFIMQKKKKELCIVMEYCDGINN